MTLFCHPNQFFPISKIYWMDNRRHRTVLEKDINQLPPFWRTLDMTSNHQQKKRTREVCMVKRILRRMVLLLMNRQPGSPIRKRMLISGTMSMILPRGLKQCFPISGAISKDNQRKHTLESKVISCLSMTQLTRKKRWEVDPGRLQQDDSQQAEIAARESDSHPNSDFEATFDVQQTETSELGEGYQSPHTEPAHGEKAARFLDEQSE
jgi:hypothetical protein